MMRLSPWIQTGILLALLAGGATLRADWINLTGAESSPNIAEITVLDDHVKLVLEVYVNDLEHFDALVPDDWLKDSDITRPPLEDRIRRFSENGFQFVTDAGERLQARVSLVEPRLRVDRKSPFAGMINPLTRQRVPGAPEDKRVLYAELIYPFTDRPETLTIVPPLDDEGRATASIGFITYHKAVPVIDFRYLGAPARLDLDWEDPWYSRFDNPNLKRHHKSALMSFLYVEPYEVRHEVLTRVRDLEQWMDLGLRGREFIEVDELEPLKQRIGEFFLERNAVLVDGKALKPILDRTNYVKVGLSGIQLVEKPERLEISTAIVGVIVTYLTRDLPQEVTVDWDLFTEQVRQVPATAIDPAGPLMTILTPDDNVHVWTNFLKNYSLPTVEETPVSGSFGELDVPVASLLLLSLLLPAGWWGIRRKRGGGTLHAPVAVAAAVVMASAVATPWARVPVTRPAVVAGDLDDAQSKQLLQVLLGNVYRAFDFREEEDVYDKLAISVGGDLLTDIYLQNRKSFAVQKAGGAQARVREVEILDASAKRVGDRPLAYAIRGNWTATGSVGHWGHVHVRRNLYDAILTVEAVDGHWKITGLELLEEKRIDPSRRPVASQAPQPADAAAEQG